MTLAGAMFFYNPFYGLPFMAAAMGGAAATAAMSPAKPGVVVSTLTLAVTAYFSQVEWTNQYIGICVGMWLFGILGRALIPGSGADAKEGLIKNEYVILA